MKKLIIVLFSILIPVIITNAQEINKLKPTEFIQRGNITLKNGISESVKKILVEKDTISYFNKNNEKISHPVSEIYKITQKSNYYKEMALSGGLGGLIGAMYAAMLSPAILLNEHPEVIISVTLACSATGALGTGLLGLAFPKETIVYKNSVSIDSLAANVNVTGKTISFNKDDTTHFSSPPSGKAKVIFYRTSKYGWPILLSVTGFDVLLGKFTPDQSIECLVNPGKYVFTAGAGTEDSEKDLFISFEPNKTYFIELTQQHKFTHNEFIFRIQQEKKGMEAMQKCHNAGNYNLTDLKSIRD